MAAGCMRARLLSTRTTNKGAVKNTAQLNISQFVVRASSHLLFGRVRVRCSYAGRTSANSPVRTARDAPSDFLRFQATTIDNDTAPPGSWLALGLPIPCRNGICLFLPSRPTTADLSLTLIVTAAVAVLAVTTRLLTAALDYAHRRELPHGLHFII